MWSKGVKTVLAVYVALWMLHITSSVEPDKYINRTIYIDTGTESLELSCGEDLWNAVTVYWSICKSDEWIKILKFYPQTPSVPTYYYEEYTADKYDISESVNTSLVVKNAELLENNLFRCTPFGEGLNSIYTTLLKIGTFSKTINMTKAPRLAVEEDSVVEYVCETSYSFPDPPVVLWFVNDVPVDANEVNCSSSGDNQGRMTISTLKLIAKREMNNKTVKCILQNNSTKMRKHNLKVLYPPDINIDGTTTPAVEYTTRNIACLATGGNPSDLRSYRYKWMYKPTYRTSANYTPVQPGSALLNNSKILQLKDLGYKEMAGTYKCIVTGIAGQSSGNSTLEVYYAAKLENTHKDLTAYTDLESTANLTVKFRVNPVINSTVYWIIGDSVLQDINIQNTLKDEQIQATYFISHVTDEKLGKYTVQVINWAMGKHNKVTFPVVLKLRGPPEKPRNVSILANSLSTITVGWEAGLNGGFEQHFKVLCREKGHRKYEESSDNFTGLKTGQSTNYTIEGLHPNKEYEIIVVAINKFRGESMSEAPMLTGIIKDYVILNPIIIGMGAFVILLVIVIIIIGSALCKIRKSNQAKPPVNKDSSQEHAFDTGGRVETTTTAEVLHDLRRNSQDTSGEQYEYISEEALSVAAIVDSGYLQPVSIVRNVKETEA